MVGTREEPKRRCPRCNGPTEETVECSLCGKVGCLERCNTAGRNAPCETCSSAAADEEDGPAFKEPEESERLDSEEE